jgi:hypothetical protein
MYRTEIWRTVALLTTNFGAEAEGFAFERVGASYTAGDRSSCELWIGVTRAVEDFLYPERRPGETAH